MTTAARTSLARTVSRQLKSVGITVSPAATRFTREGLSVSAGRVEGTAIVNVDYDSPRYCREVVALVTAELTSLGYSVVVDAGAETTLRIEQKD